MGSPASTTTLSCRLRQTAVAAAAPGHLQRRHRRRFRRRRRRRHSSSSRRSSRCSRSSNSSTSSSSGASAQAPLRAPRRQCPAWLLGRRLSCSQPWSCRLGRIPTARTTQARTAGCGRRRQCSCRLAACLGPRNQWCGMGPARQRGGGVRRCHRSSSNNSSCRSGEMGAKGMRAAGQGQACMKLQETRSGQAATERRGSRRIWAT